MPCADSAPSKSAWCWERQAYSCGPFLARRAGAASFCADRQKHCTRAEAVITDEPGRVCATPYRRTAFSLGAGSSLTIVGIGMTFAVRLTFAILRTSRQWSWQLMQVVSVLTYANVAASEFDCSAAAISLSACRISSAR